MPEFLVFQLYGPLASWGEVAVGEVRPSSLHPSRSALLGLLAAGLGLRREDEEAQQHLADSVRFAVHVLSAGLPLSDYHTVQTGRPRRGRVVTSRPQELAEPPHTLETLVSKRLYRCDAYYRVGVWSQAGASFTLEQIRDALREPAFALYLGRKACPLALPLEPQLVEAPTLREALGKARFASLQHTEFLPLLSEVAAGAGLYWEAADGVAELIGLEHPHETLRRDDPVSRRRWTFRNRTELYAPLAGEEGS